MRKSLINKKLLLVPLTLALTAGGVVIPSDAEAVSLKNNGVINDRSIMLSDIFSDLPRGKDKVLGPAPRPGKDMVLNARTLLKIATALDLPWRPVDAGEHIVLSSAATIVDFSMIEDALKSEITSGGHNGDYEIAFNGGLNDMILPQDQRPSVEVQSFSFREGSHKGGGRFEATLVAPSKAKPLKTMRVSGIAHRVMKVPVLRDTLREGMVISARDIDYIEIRERDLDHSTAMHERDLIGMTPRRLALGGKPLKMQDLQAPQIVGRGDLVTMTINQGGMKLTSQGKALENGAKGDIIRVSSLSSSKTLEAVISGERQVSVGSY